MVVKKSQKQERATERTRTSSSPNVQLKQLGERGSARPLGSAPYLNPFQVQRRTAGEPSGGDSVHEIAASGFQSAPGQMPYLGAIQQSFGRHDVSGVQAHTAPGAARALGATAYAAGERVAFASASPSLHTAAHEAAHVVQQRSGVQLAGGVGQTGDRYEQHADAVADQVVQGKSAEGLLGGTPGGSQETGVQMAGKSGKERLMALLNDPALGTSIMAVTELTTVLGIIADTANVTDEMFNLVFKLIEFVGNTFKSVAVQKAIWNAVGKAAKFGMTVPKLLKFAKVLGAAVAIGDAVINFIRGVIEVGNIVDGFKAFGQAMVGAEHKAKAAWYKYPGADKDSFLDSVDYYSVKGRAKWIGKYGSKFQGTSHNVYDAADALSGYRSTLSAAIRTLVVPFQAIARLYLCLANIVMDIIGLVGGVIGALCSAAWALLTWAVDFSKLTDVMAREIVRQINGKYVWNPFGRNVMTETFFAGQALG